MKLLSIDTIYKGALRVVKRFPVAMLAVTIGTGIGLYLVNFEKDLTSVLLNSLLTLSLAAPLYVAAILLSEAKSLKQKWHWGIHSLILLFLIGYYLLLPDMGAAVNEFYIRHGMWVFGFILVVTFVPYLFQGQTEAIKRFWQFSRGLVFALALTFVWAGALQAGISIALGSIDFLFGINIDGEVYQSVWVVLAGLFSPLFFLSRFPEKPHELSAKKEYPKEVRLFSQYVLVPLVTLYFLILYAYTIKIVVNFDWPEGQLAWMILGFSFLGVLTYLALYPLREKERWIKHFGTGLFVAMIPQTGMLFWALSFRLRDYGFTENRYFVLVFGIWLLVIAIYYLLAKVKDIRVIPISLFFIAVLTSFGPWGAFGVAERSQVNRLEGILIENGLLQDGQYVQSSIELSDTSEVEINEIVRYLSRNHGFDAIEPWFGGEDLDSFSSDKWSNSDSVITKKFGLAVRYPYEVREYYDSVRSFGLSVDAERLESAVDVSGFQYIVNVFYWDNPPGFLVNDVEYFLEIQKGENDLRLLMAGQEVAVFDLADLIESARKANGSMVSQEDAVLSVENENVKAMFLVRNLYGENDGDDMEIFSLDGLMLLAFPE